MMKHKKPRFIQRKQPLFLSELLNLMNLFCWLIDSKQNGLVIQD